MPHTLQNPYKPSAGHMPPHLAGREPEIENFCALLSQTTILKNPLITGLRGIGKTALLTHLKPIAMHAGWMWVGTDLSETASISENNIAKRLLADLSVATSAITISEEKKSSIGFLASTETTPYRLSYDILESLFNNTPGLVSDKLKYVLEYAWKVIQHSDSNIKGIIFSYDEAQNLSDKASKEEYPLSTLIDVFQSVQRKELPIMLTLSGLPVLLTKLVEARTYTERMFKTLEIGRLTKEDSEKAITVPVESSGYPIQWSTENIDTIVSLSGGYPYFIQFICKEVFDLFMAGATSVPAIEIMRKLDADFFAPRWARITDRQRDLLQLIGTLENASKEFTIQEIVERSVEQNKTKPFNSSSTNQMLNALISSGLIFKNRHGKYILAIPMMDAFIYRETHLA